MFFNIFYKIYKTVDFSDFNRLIASGRFDFYTIMLTARNYTKKKNVLR